MSLKKVHEKRNINGDLVEPDGPVEKRPRTSTPTIDGQFSDVDSDISEVYDDLSCPEQCLRPEDHTPNYAYNDDGSVNDKLTQHPVSLRSIKRLHLKHRLTKSTRNHRRG